jgi:FHS family L-fucose permease-like MFS transporter
MIGRWTSAAGAFDLKSSTKNLLGYLLPYLAFGFFMVVNVIASHDITPFYVYAFVILVLIAANKLSRENRQGNCFMYSILGITALAIGMLTEGLVSVYAFISVGLFCSTLWPCIFTAGYHGLGKHTMKAQAF